MRNIEAVATGIAIFFLFPIATVVYWLSKHLVNLTVEAVNHLDDLKY